MELNGYTLLVSGKTHDADGYVVMRNGEKFSVTVMNSNNRRASLRLKMNGFLVGEFSLNALTTGRIERPAHSNGRFTYYTSYTEDAYAAGQAYMAKSDWGLIEAVFTPEVYNPMPLPVIENFRSQSTGNFVYNTTYASSQSSSTAKSAGIIGQSGQSGQVFSSVPRFEVDTENETTIYLRLVSGDDEPRPLNVRNIKKTKYPYPL